MLQSKLIGDTKKNGLQRLLLKPWNAFKGRLYKTNGKWNFYFDATW